MSCVLATSSGLAQPRWDENLARPTQWVCCLVDHRGEQNTESKEDDVRSLVSANRKLLHPKGGIAKPEGFRGRTPPALTSTWPETLILSLLKDKLRHITHFKSLFEHVSIGIGHHQTRSG